MRYDRNEIVRLYVKEKLSMRMIRDRVGCSIETVRRTLEARGIKARPMHINRRMAGYTGAIA